MSGHVFGGEWTREKLERLEKYLKAYLVIFNKNQQAKYFVTNYVDAFAGTGYQTFDSAFKDQISMLPELGQAENQDFLKGSACIALDLEPSFHKYVFIEKDLQRIKDLEKLKNDYANRSIKILKGDANIELSKWCDITNWEKNRAVVFLDPYGMQVEWSLIEKIAGTKGIDLWILFPLGVAVNRLLTKSGPPQESWARRLTLIFGTEDWQEAFYPKKKKLTLWGEEEEQSKEATIERISEFFVERLKSIFPGVANNPLPLRNSTNNPLYLLCFAASNPVGTKTAVKIAQNILKAR